MSDTSNLAACRLPDSSWLFHVDHKQRLRYAKGPAAVSDNNADWKTGLIEVNNDNIEIENNRLIAALSYTDPKKQIRVYYINEDNELNEISNEDGGAWAHGKLNTRHYKADPKGGLTASMVQETSPGGQLQVYYYDTSDRLMVATSQPGGEWTNAPVPLKK